jgi:hypothetical protein
MPRAASCNRTEAMRAKFATANFTQMQRGSLDGIMVLVEGMRTHKL